jgi:hypothetical protein
VILVQLSLVETVCRGILDKDEWENCTIAIYQNMNNTAGCTIIKCVVSYGYYIVLFTSLFKYFLCNTFSLTLSKTTFLGSLTRLMLRDDLCCLLVIACILLYLC